MTRINSEKGKRAYANLVEKHKKDILTLDSSRWEAIVDWCSDTFVSSSAGEFTTEIQANVV